MKLFLAGILASLIQSAVAIPMIPLGFLRLLDDVVWPSNKISVNQRQIIWRDCPSGSPSTLECGRIGLPIDHSKPSGGLMAITVYRVKASSPSARTGALFFNPGGPGGKATAFCDAVARGVPLFSQDVLSRFDLICIDPRGVGLSSPTRCDPNIWNEAVDHYPQTDAEWQQMRDHNKRFGESCLKLSGEYVKYLDTVSVAKDFDAVRQALGEEKLTYMGISYGTMIGLTYAELFPGNIRKMALDGMTDHSQSEIIVLDAEVDSFEHVMTAFLAWCEKDSSCPLYGKNVTAIYETVFTKTQTGGIPAAKCQAPCLTPVSAEAFLMKSGEMLGQKNPGITSGGWAAYGQALKEASEGDASTLAMSKAMDLRYDGWQGIAVACLDWKYSQSFIDNRYKQDLILNRAPLTKGMTGTYTFDTFCSGWPVPLVNPNRCWNTTAIGQAPPILMVDSTSDQATAYPLGVENRHKIPNSVLMTRVGYGHGSYFLHGETSKAMDRFLIDGVMPAHNTLYSS